MPVKARMEKTRANLLSTRVEVDALVAAERERLAAAIIAVANETGLTPRRRIDRIIGICGLYTAIGSPVTHAVRRSDTTHQQAAQPTLEPVDEGQP